MEGSNDSFKWKVALVVVVVVCAFVILIQQKLYSDLQKKLMKTEQKCYDWEAACKASGDLERAAHAATQERISELERIVREYRTGKRR